MTIELRRLQYADINLLRELRNANADSFFCSKYITREMQEDWWYIYQYGMNSKIRRTDFYTIWMNGITPVGFLSARSIPLSIDVGRVVIVAREIGNLLLAPAYRGQSIMHAAITEVRRLYDPLTFWVAHVKPDNKASLKLFERQGFWRTPNEARKPLPHERQRTG